MLPLDTKTGPPGYVRRLAGGNLSLMGGVGNLSLLNDSPEEVSSAALSAVKAGIDVAGPECAVPLGAPIANLRAIAQKPGSI